MKIKQYDIWLADLNTRRGTEPGKTRPVVVVQTDLLNETHLSTIICPITTNVIKEIELLRVHLKKGQLEKLSDILVDQILLLEVFGIMPMVRLEGEKPWVRMNYFN